MGLSARLERLVPDLAATLRRVPVPVFWSIVLTVYLHYHIARQHAGLETDMIMAAAAGFFAGGAAHLFAEGRGLSPSVNLGLALAAGAAAAVLGYFNQALHVSALLLFCGLIALTMVAPFLRRGSTQGALWFFNLRFGLAALLAFLAGLAFALGLLAITTSLKFLFGIDPIHNVEEHVVALAAALVAPIYGLALMPRDLDTALEVADHRGSPLERGVSVLVNYILVPVVVIYALILHAYAAKIALIQSLPKGQIGTMVAIFAVGGTGVWLISWPWRDTGTRLLRLFMRGWFWLTIIPSALLVMAIWRRVADYGVTADRYGLALIALWTVLVTIYLAVRRNAADMRAIIGSMAFLLLAASFGPQGAFGLSVHSQLARFTAFLEARGLWQDGHIVLPEKPLTDEDRRQGHDLVNTLSGVGGLDDVLALFPDNIRPAKETAPWSTVGNISGKLGFSDQGPPEDALAYNSSLPGLFPVPADALLVGPLYVSTPDYAPLGQQGRTAWNDGTAFHVRTLHNEYRFTASELVPKIMALPKPQGEREPAIIELSPGVSLIITSAYGRGGKLAQLSSMNFWLMEKHGTLAP